MTDIRVNPLRDAISGALTLIRQEGDIPLQAGLPAPIPSLPSLLDQCRALHARAVADQAEPLRTLHHMACSGGTLISKCLAVMPNTLLLSEVAPLSRMGLDPTKPRFLPSDLLQLLKTSNRPFTNDALTEVFLAGLAVLLRQMRERGARLVLRDHAHSQFCTGPEIFDYPPLHRLVAPLGPVLSVVTLRHPLDSYLSLLNNKWESHQPAGLDEYARRYLAFLDAHDGLPTFRYEEFTEDPESVLRQICDSLHIPFSPHAVNTFNMIHMSGDSGRSGPVIGKRQRREVPPHVAAAAETSETYRSLCARMGY
jgi:hypothetical protein